MRVYHFTEQPYPDAWKNHAMMGHAGTLSHAETVANLTVFAKEVLPRLKTYRQSTMDVAAA
jgi:hypothetical protein